MAVRPIHINLRHLMVVAEGNPPKSPFTKGGLLYSSVCIEALLAPLCKGGLGGFSSMNRLKLMPMGRTAVRPYEKQPSYVKLV